MRIKSSLFVQSIMHLVGLTGNFSTLLNKGADEAGAIFLVHLKSRNHSDFYGQVPQTFIDEDEAGHRLFELLGEDLETHDLSDKIASQLKFDPDCWIVELECPKLPDVISVVETR